MAGEAFTNAFMLSTATVMVGATTDLFNLNPAAHSVGLVKNFQITAEPTYTELTQGIKNNIVYSVLTQNPVRCTMEVYEFTSKNLAYGLGLDGSSLAATTSYAIKTGITGGAGTGTTGVVFTAADLTTTFAVGKWIEIQEAGTDKVHIARITSSSYATGDNTVVFADHDVPTGLNFTTAAKVRVLNRLNVGSKAEQPYLAAKIVGIMPDGNTGLTVLVPKMRIVKGFTLGFQSDNFGNLPFEFTPYELVSTDDNYADFVDGPVAVMASQ